jgi:Undecaprenyl-phosphate galactose phosphotransferase WbaP
MLKISKNKQISRISLIISDTISVLFPAFFIYNFYEVKSDVLYFRGATILGVLLFLFSILFSSQTIFEQYTTRRSFYDEFIELMQLYLFCSLAFLSSLFVFELSEDRQKHLLFLFFVFLLILIFRCLARHILNYFGFWRISCIIICPKSEFEYAKTAIESQFNLGMTVRPSSLENRLLMKLINQYERLSDLSHHSIKSKIVDYYTGIGSPHIIIFSHRSNSIYIPKIVELLVLCGLPFSIIPDVGGVSLLGARISHFFRWEVLLITPQNNIERLSYQILKRIFDIIFSVIFVCVLALPMAIIYIMVRLDGGPGLFKHKRIGKDGVVFDCMKFRSMATHSDILLKEFLQNNIEAQFQWETDHKIINDPRITTLGKFLRVYSLDELPQLYNVIMGDMSLVGPRPITESEKNQYGKNIELYTNVRPGITGLWQISGRSNTTYSYRVSMDVWYIKNWSLLYDVAILIKTIWVVINKSGAR